MPDNFLNAIKFKNFDIENAAFVSLNQIMENVDVHQSQKRMCMHAVDNNNVLDCITSIQKLQIGELSFIILQVVDLTLINELEAVKQKEQLI